MGTVLQNMEGTRAVACRWRKCWLVSPGGSRLLPQVRGLHLTGIFGFLAVLGFELRALHLLGRCSTSVGGVSFRECPLVTGTPVQHGRSFAELISDHLYFCSFSLFDHCVVFNNKPVFPPLSLGSDF
jgi:hypothetical protein